MPDLAGGVLPSTLVPGGHWVKLHELDFTALTSTTWTSADVNVDQTVDGYVFQPRTLNTGSASVGSASGLVGTDPATKVWWKLNKGANAIDLSNKSYLAFVANVTEPWPWSGWAGIQFGWGAWDPGWDFMRTSTSAIQVARRQSGTSYGTGGPTMTAAQTSAWLMICTPWLSNLHTQTGVASGVLPAPDDPGYTLSFSASVQKNTRYWPWSGSADADHVLLAYGGHSAGFGLRQLAIYSLEDAPRLD